MIKRIVFKWSCVCYHSLGQIVSATSISYREQLQQQQRTLSKNAWLYQQYRISRKDAIVRDIFKKKRLN